LTGYEFPSDTFPALPHVHLDLPEGWEPAAVAGPVLAVVKQVEDRHFAPNITVSITRHTAGYAVSEAMSALAEEASALAEGAADEPFTTVIGEREYVGRNLAFRHPDAGPLVQIHLLTGVDAGTIVDAVHLTATLSAEGLPQGYEDLQQVLRTARVG
jgi:hypothetical protein